MKNHRLFQILYILLDKGSATAPELARTLEVSVRTIYRDIEALSMAGIPVCTSQGKGGGVSLMPNYAFSKALLSDDEQNQILFAMQSLRAAERPVDALLNKLGGMFQKGNVRWIEVDFSRWRFGRADTETFDRLKTAILGKRALDVLYCNASGETAWRSILPFKLIFKDKSWYLQAFCEKAADYRLFKISRILEMDVTDRHFARTFEDAPPVEIDMGPCPEFTRVKLRFAPSAAFRVFDEFDRRWIERQTDGSLTVEARLPVDSWGIGYLYSFGTDVDVLEPAALRAGLADYAKRIYAHHKT
ncbi:MAG TPA: YafY family protein [Eubacteriales bacterium]|nr:YafY family protein [Eubacteriales bacterium]